MEGTAETRQGQSLVELAVCLPFLLLLLLGTLDLGRMFFDYVQMRQAVREGASYAARNPLDTAGINQAVQSAGIPAGVAISFTCTGSCATNGGAGYVTVSATETFTPITTNFLSTYFGIRPFTLTASATMRAMT